VTIAQLIKEMSDGKKADSRNYKSTDTGFERDGKATDWSKSKVLLGSNRLKAKARSTLATRTANRQYWKLLAKRNSDCEKFWDVTRHFLREHAVQTRATIRKDGETRALR
jgi:hypothetical protein